MKKTKRITAIILSALMTVSAFSALSVSAATVDSNAPVVSADDNLVSGDFKYSVLDDGTVEIAKYLGSDTDVSIPEKIDGKVVSSIGSWTFYDCTSLTSITIPDSVTSISDDAFSNCENLTDITIPDSVTSIGSRAFYGCKSLTSITIPDSVTNIGDDAFCFCENLTDITIPNSVTYIGVRAFCNTGITSIVVPDSVSNLGGGAFSGCEKLKTAKLPKSLNVIPDNLFSQCYELENANIPDNVTKIDTQAFQDCKKLSKVNLPSSIKEIGMYAFNGCTSLKDIDIPDQVEIIGALSFCDCSLTQITLPKSVTEINEYALGYNDLYPNSMYFEASQIVDFKIYGYNNTAAEKYALDNGFEFIALDDEAVTGDSNQDGIVNVNDVTYLQMHIAGKKTTDGSAFIDETNKLLFDCIDMNKDGKLTVTDVTALQIYISKNN